MCTRISGLLSLPSIPRTVIPLNDSKARLLTHHRSRTPPPDSHPRQRNTDQAPRKWFLQTTICAARALVEKRSSARAWQIPRPMYNLQHTRRHTYRGARAIFHPPDEIPARARSLSARVHLRLRKIGPSYFSDALMGWSAAPRKTSSLSFRYMCVLQPGENELLSPRAGGIVGGLCERRL